MKPFFMLVLIGLMPIATLYSYHPNTLKDPVKVEPGESYGPEIRLERTTMTGYVFVGHDLVEY